MFKKLFKKGGGNTTPKAPKGFHFIEISSVDRLTTDTVKVVFDIPDNLKNSFHFTAGQYINVCVTINGKEERRSYSICSGENEALSVAVKAIENGKVSNWFNSEAAAGTQIAIGTPEGNFTRPSSAKNVVAIAAGSGITPIMSIAKDIETTDGTLQLFFCNRSEDTILFKSEIDALQKTTPSFYLTGEEKDGYGYGRINKETFTDIVKQNLDILKSDGFFICGPEQMIMEVAEVLKMFGVSEDKVHYELFTTPVLMADTSTEEVSDFKGTSQVTVILDDEVAEFELAADGASVLDAVINEGFDAPYSCRGGVCSSCKAKVTEGKASMTLNYSLTDDEVAEGYILTCQAHPATEKIKISYDD